MLRIVDVPKALAVRGYPSGVRAELHLEVRDELLEANNGRWILRVENGEGTVEPGGEGGLKTTARGLAPLFSGFLAPAALRRSGFLEADEETVAIAGSTFGGPSPYMSEQF